MQICTKCKLEKQDKEFYTSKNKQSGYTSWCKACMKQLSQKRNKEGRKHARSTGRVLRLLAEHGIPAFADRRICGPYIDIVAWGCVPVEAKLSSQFGDNKFIWSFSPNQLQKLEGFIVLIAYYHRKKQRVLVVPTEAIDPEKLEGDNGSRSICLTLDSYHHLSHWPEFEQFEDAFELITESLSRYAQNYTTDMLAIRER